MANVPIILAPAESIQRFVVIVTQAFPGTLKINYHAKHWWYLGTKQATNRRADRGPTCELV